MRARGLIVLATVAAASANAEPDAPPPVAASPKTENQDAVVAHGLTVVRLQVDGQLDQSLVQRQLDGQLSALAPCWTDGGATTPSVTIRFSVLLSGEVVGVYLGELPSTVEEGCVVGATKALRFSPSTSSTTVEVVVRPRAKGEASAVLRLELVRFDSGHGTPELVKTVLVQATGHPLCATAGDSYFVRGTVTGQLLRVQVSGGSAAGNACIKQAVETGRYPAAPGRYSVEALFEARRVLAEKSLARVRDGSPLAIGQLDRSAIRRIVRRHLPRIRLCYEALLSKDPFLQGRTMVRFSIDPRGRVLSATARGMSHRQVESCVEGVVRSMTFPSPADGRPVTVSYPFVFRSQGP